MSLSAAGRAAPKLLTGISSTSTGFRGGFARLAPNPTSIKTLLLKPHTSHIKLPTGTRGFRSRWNEFQSINKLNSKEASFYYNYLNLGK